MHDLNTVIGLIDMAAVWLRGKNTDQWAQPWPNREARDNRVRMGIKAEQTWILKAEDGTIAATISADREGNPKLWNELELADRAVYVQRLVIDQRFAGLGLGAELIDWAGRQAREQYGATLIRIDVWTSNLALQDYYQDNGFDFLRYCSDPEYPAGALLQKATAAITVPANPLFEESPEYSWRVLADPNFRRYFAGTACSNIGTWLQNTTQILLAYRLTESVMVVGLVSCAQFASPVLLGPRAAAVADRFNRRRLLITAQLGSAAIAAALAGLTFTDRLTPVLLIAGALAMGLTTVTLPTLSAVIPTLVVDSGVRAAMRLNAMSYYAGRVVGALAGIAVVTYFGFGWSFAINAATCLALTGAIMTIRPRIARKSRQRPRLRAGLRRGLQNRRIRLLLVMVASVAAALDPAIVLGPAVADRIGGSDVLAGYFIAALGAGTLTSLFIPLRTYSLRATARLIGALGVTMVIFSTASQIWLSVLAAFMAGGTALMAGAATNALLLKEVGQQHAGQIVALWTIALAAGRPLMSLLDGWLAGVGGLRTAGLILVVPALVVGALSVPVVVQWGRAYLACRPAGS